jgi:hypothetical protein
MKDLDLGNLLLVTLFNVCAPQQYHVYALQELIRSWKRTRSLDRH